MNRGPIRGYERNSTAARSEGELARWLRSRLHVARFAAALYTTLSAGGVSLTLAEREALEEPHRYAEKGGEIHRQERTSRSRM